MTGNGKIFKTAQMVVKGQARDSQHSKRLSTNSLSLINLRHYAGLPNQPNDAERAKLPRSFFKVADLEPLLGYIATR